MLSGVNLTDVRFRRLLGVVISTLNYFFCFDMRIIWRSIALIMEITLIFVNLMQNHAYSYVVHYNSVGLGVAIFGDRVIFSRFHSFFNRNTDKVLLLSRVHLS